MTPEEEAYEELAYEEACAVSAKRKRPKDRSG
jgi:hypothetical protein